MVYLYSSIRFSLSVCVCSFDARESKLNNLSIDMKYAQRTGAQRAWAFRQLVNANTSRQREHRGMFGSCRHEQRRRRAAVAFCAQRRVRMCTQKVHHILETCRVFFSSSLLCAIVNHLHRKHTYTLAYGDNNCWHTTPDATRRWHTLLPQGILLLHWHYFHTTLTLHNIREYAAGAGANWGAMRIDPFILYMHVFAHTHTRPHRQTQTHRGAGAGENAQCTFRSRIWCVLCIRANERKYICICKTMPCRHVLTLSLSHIPQLPDDSCQTNIMVISGALRVYVLGQHMGTAGPYFVCRYSL